MQQGGFLIGALIGTVAAELDRRVLDGLHAAGFIDIRRAHSEILRLLPPEGCRVTELAERMHSSKQAVGYLVEYLEDRGYLERRPDPADRRAQIIRRTERGWAVNGAAWRSVQEVQGEWAHQLGEERMVTVLESLNALVRLLGITYEGSVAEASARASAPPAGNADPADGSRGST